MGKFYYIDDMRNELSGICRKKIGEVYPQDVIPAAIVRLEYELEALSRIRGGDRAFLETMAFARKLRNLCRGAGSGYKPRISFRGPVLASLIAYLTGISEHDPIALGFYPWIFYEKPSVVEFNFNLPMRAIQMINNYDLNVPKSDVIYLGRDASVIELVEEGIPGVLIHYDIPDYRINNSEIKGFFDKAIKKGSDRLDYLVGFDNEYVPHARDVLEYLSFNDELPSSIEQLAKLDGFIHSSLFNDDYISAMDTVEGSLYDSLISYTEDISDILIRGGCETEKAKMLARKVKSAKQILAPDEIYIIERYCGKKYAKMMSNIKHLYCKSQCFEVGLIESELIYLINHHSKLTSEAYEKVCRAI